MATPPKKTPKGRKPKPPASRKKAGLSRTPAKSTVQEEKPAIANLEDKLFRLMGMVLFALLLVPIYWVFIFLAGLQYVIFFVEDNPNEELSLFTGKLTSYIRQILAYLSFATEDLPFPFSKFPLR